MKTLYYATCQPLLESIKRTGLRCPSKMSYDKDIAASYAMMDDEIPESLLDKIITIGINPMLIDQSKLVLDPEVIDNDGLAYAYDGIIPPELLCIDGFSSKLLDYHSMIQGLEDLSIDDIESRVYQFIDDRLSEDGMFIDVQRLMVHGSRVYRDSHEKSDLDVVIFYSGDDTEDRVSKSLNRAPCLEINGIEVDFQPVRSEESGTIDRYVQKCMEQDRRASARRKIKRRLGPRFDERDHLQPMLLEKMIDYPDLANEVFAMYNRSKLARSDENDLRLTFISGFERMISEVQKRKI